MSMWLEILTVTAAYPIIALWAYRRGYRRAVAEKRLVDAADIIAESRARLDAAMQRSKK